VVVDVDRAEWTPTWPHPTPAGRPGDQYSQAPVVEAILDVRVEGSDVPLDALDGFARVLPGWEDSIKGVARDVRANEDTGTTEETDPTAYGFMRSDRRRRILVSPNRLGYSWLGEYKNWDHLVTEFTEVWEAFRPATFPQAISRISARFVNVIEIPGQPIEISDYVRTRVDVAPNLPQSFTDYFMQIDIPLDDDLGVVVTSATTEPREQGHTALALDLDTYDQARLNLDTDSFIPLGERLTRLRKAKNYVFEASITDATRDLIK
jgi:uncharacterized protein (TIGR04255 family)